MKIPKPIRSLVCPDSATIFSHAPILQKKRALWQVACLPPLGRELDRREHGETTRRKWAKDTKHKLGKPNSGKVSAKHPQE